MNPTITDLKAWLTKHDCHHVRPVSVSLGTPRKTVTEVFDGCSYRRTLAYTADMMAVTHGDKKAGDTYTEVSCYLLGERPKAVMPGAPRHTKVCFRNSGAQDWYIAGWCSAASITDKNREFNPFGPSFIMKPWSLSEPIDFYERHHVYHDRHVPYTRYSIIFDVDIS